MSTHPQLEWSQGASDTQAELEKLRRENHDLKRQLKEEREKSQEAIRDARKQSLQAVRSQAKLKQVLSPIYQAFQMIFDELEDVEAEAGGGGFVVAPQSAEKWEIWKRKLPGKPAEFIQALLEHGELNSAQLKSLTHSGISTVPQIIYKLNSLGLINKNGGRYSLKQI